jgi:ATP-dependent protease ClpP protease subunit
MRKFLKIDPRLRIEDLDDVMSIPEIIRVNDFDEEALEDFEEALDDAHATGQSVIPIVIDSYGGSAYGVLGMIAAVEQARVPVATILTSKAMSAGAILFMFGTEGYRYMHPSANMMIHDIGSWTGGKVEEIKADTRNLDEMNKSVYTRASKHIGKDPDLLANLIKEHNHVDWFLGAKEAKKYNIANHLKIPCFEVEISLNVKFG